LVLSLSRASDLRRQQLLSLFRQLFYGRANGVNQMAGATSLFGERFLAKALPAGVSVGLGTNFLPSTARVQLQECFESNDTFGSHGYWVGAKNKYLGVKFVYRGETHYGWARITTEAQIPCKVKAVLSGYVYESEPNTPIITSQTSSSLTEPDETLPAFEPAALGWLARGADGLPVWRK
jgi:hypothetical protein